MGFLSFWPLALLVLVPVIILLYILRQEAKQHKFSSTMLWQEVFRNIEATKPWERLKKNLLLFLQILTVLLFILAMMGPWLRMAGSRQQQVILVIDNSASMDTLYSGSKTRLQAAKEAACDYVDSLPANALLYVICGNRQAVLVLSNSTDKTEAKARIRSIEQTSFAGDMSVSLGLVQSCASQSEDAQIVFFTDTAFDPGGLNASVDSFYNDAENLAVETVSYAWRGDKILVLVQVSNYSGETQKREINLYGQNETGAETLLDIGTVTIGAGEREPLYFELDGTEAAGISVFRAELNGSDALAGDNEAWCVVEDITENRVLLLTTSNLFVEKAFSNLSGVEVYRTADPDVAGEGSDYDLYVFDGMVPDTLPARGNFLFLNCEYEDFFLHKDTVEGVMLNLLESEVTSYVSGIGIGVNKALVYDLPPWGSSFLETDSRSAGFYGIYDGHKIAVMGFDLHQTDFGLRAEFPILISDLADYLLEESLIEENSYVAGDSVLLHGSTRGSDLTLVLPDGSTQKLEASEASGSYQELARTGVYEVSQELEGTVKSQKFTAGFPCAQESSVESAEQMIAEENGVTEASARTGMVEIRNYLLLLLLVLLLVEWIVYIRMQ